MGNSKNKIHSKFQSKNSKNKPKFLKYRSSPVKSVVTVIVYSYHTL